MDKTHLSRSATLCIVNCSAMRVLHRACAASASCSGFLWMRPNESARAPCMQETLSAHWTRVGGILRERSTTPSTFLRPKRQKDAMTWSRYTHCFMTIY